MTEYTHRLELRIVINELVVFSESSNPILEVLKEIMVFVASHNPFVLWKRSSAKNVEILTSVGFADASSISYVEEIIGDF